MIEAARGVRIGNATVTSAEPDALVFVAVTVTVAGLGTDAGAVYVAVVVVTCVMVPTVVLPPWIELTCQVTVELEFAMVAVNCAVPLGETLVTEGETTMLATVGAGSPPPQEVSCVATSNTRTDKTAESSG